MGLGKAYRKDQRQAVREERQTRESSAPQKKVIISEREKPANKTSRRRVSNESVFPTVALTETANESGHLEGVTNSFNGWVWSGT